MPVVPVRDSQRLLRIATERHPEPVLVLDSAWDVDAAKSACAAASDWFRENAGLVARYGCERFLSCQPMTVIADACARDPVREVREFEVALAAQFAATPECATVRLVDLAGPREAGKAAAAAMRHPHWSLGLDFSPGARAQQWTMSNSADRASYAQGEGDPHDIAAQACAAIRAAGAG